MRHCTVDLGGPVHYCDFGGSGRPIVLVHGLGGAWLNWLSVGPRLAAHGRVLAVDLAGHGLTRCRRGGARVSSNLRLLGRFVEEVAREPVVLVGNSMGGYLAMAEAAAEPEKVTSLVLVDPACPLARGAAWDRRVFWLFLGYSLPLAGQAMMWRGARRGPEALVRDMLALCCVDPSRVDREVVKAHVDLARERLAYGRVAGRDFLTAQRSLMARLLRRRKFFSMVASIRARALVVQGDRDRLVQLAAARALAAARPDWRLEVIEGVGHVPQLEAPDRFLALVEPWLAEPAGQRHAPRLA